MTGNLSTDLADTIQEFSKQFYLEKKEEEFSEENFGNAFIVLESREFAIRIVRDRGDIFFDLAKPHKQWRDADKVVEALGLHPDPESYITAAQLFHLLTEHREEILDSL